MQPLEISSPDIDIGKTIEEGLRLCRDEEWQAGLEILWAVARKRERKKGLPTLYYSYAGYGAARFDRNVKEGLSLCRYAIRLNPAEPDNYLNLARVEMLRRNRRGAVKALNRGLRIEPGHKQLCNYKREIGSRRRPVIPFLSRDNRLNIWFGKRRHLRQLEADEL